MILLEHRMLYLAKKYMVPSLAEKCTEYLQNNLDPSNVLSILPPAEKYEEKNLVDRCWKVIDEQTEAAVKSDGFVTIERCLLEAIVLRETLTIAEIELFKGVELWATKECERRSLQADGKQKRRILGEQIVKGIRFPAMQQRDFANVVLDSGILITEEIIQLVKHKRSGPLLQRCCRFNSVVHRGSSLSSTDCINLSVDKDILLHGLRLFGSENNVTTVELEIKESSRRSVSVKAGQFSSERYELELFGYYGFTVSFDKPIVMKKNTVYHLQAKIKDQGLATLCGDVGVRSVICSDVTFSFTDCGGGNGTNIQRRQFPELLFSQ